MKFSTRLLTAVLTFSGLLSYVLPLSAMAQSKVPARQVSVVSSNWTYITPAADTAQSTFDWLDSDLDDTSDFLTIDPAGWTNFLAGVTNNASLQALLDEIDAESGPFLAGTYITDALYTPATLTWTLYTNGFPVDTNDWDYLAPTAATVQATFDFLDAGGPLLKGTNIAGATYSGITDEWTIDGYTNVPVVLHLRTLESNVVSGVASNVGYQFSQFYDVGGVLTNTYDNDTGILTVPKTGIYLVTLLMHARGADGSITDLYFEHDHGGGDTTYSLHAKARMNGTNDLSLAYTASRIWEEDDKIAFMAQTTVDLSASQYFGDRVFTVTYLGEDTTNE